MIRNPENTLAIVSCRPVAVYSNNDVARVIEGRGLSTIVAERIAQINDRGFDLAHDQLRHPIDLVRYMRTFLDLAETALAAELGAVDRLTADPAPLYTDLLDEQDPRTCIVKAAALAWALLDRLDFAPAGEASHG
ncbi:hypothetical protein FHS96_004959 [Sphingomonas zeicaulis]|uniref:hypothetical protein n=1 Tax=Sphingomonas zeicaulis TaxID=1632740 RepID=UPI003D19FB7B